MADHAVAGSFTGTGSLTGALVREVPITGSFTGTGTLTLETDDISYDRAIVANFGISVEIELDDSLFVIERSQFWWHLNWLYRRNIWVQPNADGIETGHPITMYLSNDVIIKNKMRSDLADLEVLRLVSQVPEVWKRVPYSAVLGESSILIQWENDVEILADTNVYDVYYIYYGNHELIGDEEVPEYTPDPYPISLSPGSASLSYTRPGEHWVVEGDLSVSRTVGAKTTLVFDGDQVRLKADMGPAYGIAEVQIDDGAWEKVDLYYFEDLPDEVVFEATGLGLGEHAFRYRHTDTKHPAAFATDVNFSHVEYRKNARAIDLGEEANETLLWGSVIGGVVGGT